MLVELFTPCAGIAYKNFQTLTRFCESVTVISVVEMERTATYGQHMS